LATTAKLKPLIKDIYQSYLLLLPTAQPHLLSDAPFIKVLDVQYRVFGLAAPAVEGGGEIAISSDLE